MALNITSFPLAAGKGAAGLGLAAVARARGRTRRGPEATVGQAMTRAAVPIDARARAARAAEVMAEEGVGELTVCEDERPLGVVTDRDLVVRVLAQGADPERIRIAECLDGDLETVSAEAPLSEAAARMDARAVRRLPVLRRGRLTGIVTLGDIARRDAGTAASVERAISRVPADARSAMWLFRRPYVQAGGSSAD